MFRIMNKLVLFSFLAAYTQSSHAGFIQYFKDEAGETKWQYVANFSSAVLIVLLSITVVTLFFSHRRASKANKALTEIRAVLEQRVLERTATLDKSNHLLVEANQALEGEIDQHKQTAMQLKASEAYLKNIMQSMPSMLIGLDDESNITQWNNCAEDITGVDYAHAVGKNLWEAYPTITISPEQVQDVIVSGIPSTIKHSQRGQYYFDIRIFPLQGQLSRGVVILVDNVTQRTLAENMLIQRDKMSSMGELASTMAYDIDIPLQGIIKDIEKTQASFEDANIAIPKSVQALLTDAVERGSQASSVIRNLLEFSRSNADKKQLEDIPEVIEHALELAKNTLSDPSGLRLQDVTIERRIEEKLPKLPCFVSELKQVFLSLIRHSVHALGKVTKDDFTPTIMIEAIECYDAIWIKVQHNGLGLTAEEQQDLFEPFVNSWPEKSVEAEPENRLSFTHFIITEHHQGQIAITSDINVGTTFHIQLQLN